ncbi:MAG: hypothetical protein HY887_04665, partial [Deltaproteobacteria bacterium]|nr:hypothetical protein [Deltaproteobacteria bacterium]
MTTRPYLLILFAALLISGCGSAEYPGKGAPKASAKDDLSARALAKR